MEKIIGIFDEQNAYAERLKRYINEKKDIGCFAVSFKEEQELKNFCAKKNLNYLLLGGTQATHPEQIAVPYGVRLWVLSEEEPEQEEENGFPVLFRYQKAATLVRSMLQSELAREERLSELFVVCSPESSCLAERYADRLLAKLSEKGRTLFLPWDPFAGCGRLEEGRKEGSSISELLYLMRKDRVQARQLFSGLFRRNGAECFCGPDYCTDLWQYSAAEMSQLVGCCREFGGYRQVVFLAGAFHEGIISIMNQSGKVYLVCSETEEGERRKKEFYRQMKYAGQQGILSRLTEVQAEGKVEQ